MSRETRVSLPIDTDGSSIQALTASTAAVVLTVTGTTGRVALPAGSNIVEIACLTAVHFRFGDSGVNAAATDRLLPAGAVVVYTVPFLTPNTRATHVAFLKAAGAVDGLVSVGDMQ